MVSTDKDRIAALEAEVESLHELRQGMFEAAKTASEVADRALAKAERMRLVVQGVAQWAVSTAPDRDAGLVAVFMTYMTGTA